MNSPKSEDNSPKLNQGTMNALIGIVILTVIVSLLLYNYLPKEEKVTGSLAVVSMGITICAFLPQLMTNYLNKSHATNPVLAIFLIMAAIGVLLRIPALRQSLGIARGHKKGVFIALLISMVTLLPLIAHIIWQWQGAIYDTEEAIIAKDILIYSAPISTIISFLITIWLFSVKPIK
jgi:hypothetical protein